MTRAGRGGLLRCGWGRRRDEEEEEDRTGGTQEFSPFPTFHSGLQRIVSDTRVNACTCTHRGTHATTTPHIQPSVRERARAHAHTYVRTPCIHGPTLVRGTGGAHPHTFTRDREAHTCSPRLHHTPRILVDHAERPCTRTGASASIHTWSNVAHMCALTHESAYTRGCTCIHT